MRQKSKKYHMDELHHMPNKDFLVNTFYHERNSTGVIINQHWHENMEFVHIINGQVKVRIDEEEFMAGPGDVIVVNSGEMHCYECETAPMLLSCVVVDLFVLNSRFYDACEVKYLQPIFHNQVLFKNFLPENKSICHYIDEIANEFINLETGYELAIKAYIYNLLVNLLRKHTKTGMTFTNESILKDSLYAKMNLATKYIENNYTENITLEDTAELTGFSKYYFCKVFKKITGKTFSEYVNYMRIIEALRLFKETDMSITDIAMTIGFNDLNYFSRVFKSVTGIRPSQIRKKIDLCRLN